MEPFSFHSFHSLILQQNKNVRPSGHIKRPWQTIPQRLLQSGKTDKQQIKQRTGVERNHVNGWPRAAQVTIDLLHSTKQNMKVWRGMLMAPSLNACLHMPVTVISPTRICSVHTHRGGSHWGCHVREEENTQCGKDAGPSGRRPLADHLQSWVARSCQDLGSQCVHSWRFLYWMRSAKWDPMPQVMSPRCPHSSWLDQKHGGWMNDLGVCGLSGQERTRPAGGPKSWGWQSPDSNRLCKTSRYYPVASGLFDMQRRKSPSVLFGMDCD